VSGFDGRSSSDRERPRIGLVTVRFQLFDAQLGNDRVARIKAHATRSATILEGAFEVVRTPLIESEADAATVAASLADERLDAVVLAPAMAAPPSFARIALAGTDAPVVIWNAPAITRLPADYRQDEATVHSTTVGAVMYDNVLVREGRSPAVVTAAHEDEQALQRMLRMVRAAAAAGSVRGATFLRLGPPIPGYLDVEATDEELARLGVREVALGQAEWEQLVEQVDPAAARRLLADIRARWKGDPGESAEWSARVALALGQALDTAGALGGTVNCHGPWFRNSGVVGLPACLGVASQAAAGRPVSCTGDQPTAIALVLARRVAGAALYCEAYVPESETGLVLVAAGGEGDPAWAEPPDAVTIEANDHYPGTRGEGTSVAFALRRGPATLVSLSPEPDGWVLAWATGEIVETRYRDMRGPNGMFRFDSGPSQEVVSAWIASGATHHNALAPGRLEVEVPVLADALGIRHVRI
jgi:L-arabinose isomerase